MIPHYKVYVTIRYVKSGVVMSTHFNNASAALRAAREQSGPGVVVVINETFDGVPT